MLIEQLNCINECRNSELQPILIKPTNLEVKEANNENNMRDPNDDQDDFVIIEDA